MMSVSVSEGWGVGEEMITILWIPHATYMYIHAHTLHECLLPSLEVCGMAVRRGEAGRVLLGEVRVLPTRPGFRVTAGGGLLPLRASARGNYRHTTFMDTLCCVQWNLRIKDTWGPEQVSFIQRCPLFGG